MALHTLLALAATLSAAGIQDPRMDLQIAMPAADQNLVQQTRPATDPFASTTSKLPAQGVVVRDANPAIDFVLQGQAISTPVSASFTKEVPATVLEWLQKQDISFVVNEDDIAQGTKITLKLQDVSLDEALDAIGSALGGHWERRGKVRVFHRGNGSAFPGSPFGFGSFGGETMKAVPALPPLPPMANSKEFTFEMKKMAEDMAKSFGPTQAKEHAQMAKEMAQHEREMAKVRGDMAKAIQDRAFEVAKMAPLESLKIDARQQADIAKEMAKAFREQDIEFKKLPMRDLKVNEEIAKAMKEARIAIVDAKAARAAVPARKWQQMEVAPDVDKLLKSLTAEQKDNLKKLGYIRFHDLTSQQKALLGIKPSTTPGSWTIKIRKNQNEITIKE